MTSAGAGYNTVPKITISGGGGTGAAATCSIETVYNGVIRFNVIDGGVGYGTEPTVTVGQPGAGTTAVGIASVGYAGVDNDLFYEDKTMMLFGDGKAMMTQLNNAVKEL